MSFLPVLFFAILCSVVQGYKLDMCRVKPPVVKDFQLQKLEGTWYEYSRLPNIFQYFYKDRCNTNILTKDGDKIHVTNSFINVTSGQKVVNEGKLSVDASRPGEVRLVFPSVPVDDYLQVVDTDYKNYVVFYYCNTFGIFRIEMGWILTSERELTDSQKEDLVKRLDNLKIDTKRLIYVDQKNC